MRRVVTIAATMTLLVALSAAPAAQAVLKQNGRFVFDPYTFKNHDPVNVVFLGGYGNDCQVNVGNGQDRSPYCFRKVVQSAWRANGTMQTRACNGHDDLRFVVSGQPQVRTNELSTSTSGICKRQYHLRMWGDYAVNPTNEWTVGVMYRENRGFFRFGKGSHHINQAWESSEEVLTWEMATRTSQDPNEKRYCKVDDWRPVSGQSPGRTPGQERRYRGWLNNGWISRISGQEVDPVTGCYGA